MLQSLEVGPIVLRRRSFISRAALLTAAPLASISVRAAARLRVALLSSLDPRLNARTRERLEVFRSEMNRLGWREGTDIIYELHFTGSELEGIMAAAKRIVAARVDLIIAINNAIAQATKKATSTIPIVAYMADAVEFGYIESLSKPGGNLTGVVEPFYSLVAKRIQLLIQATAAKRIAFLSPAEAFEEGFVVVQRAAVLQGVELVPVAVRRPDRLEDIIQAIKSTPSADAWFVNDDINFNAHAQALAESLLDLQKRAMFATSQYVRAGGLMSYGPDRIVGTGRLAYFADRILRGERPADLPAETPTRYDLVINTETARRLGLKLPQSLVLQATELIG